MKELLRFSPAEAWFVLHGTQAPPAQLLRYTFIDLLCRGALHLEESPGAAPDGPPALFVVAPAAPAYAALPQEEAFLACFRRDGLSRVLLKHYYLLVRQQFPLRAQVYQRLSSSPRLAGTFSRTWWQKLAGGFSLTSEGLALAQSLQAEITALLNQLARLQTDDPAAAQALLIRLQAHAWLLRDAEPAPAGTITDEQLAAVFAQAAAANLAWNEPQRREYDGSSAFGGDSSSSSSSGATAAAAAAVTGFSGFGEGHAGGSGADGDFGGDGGDSDGGGDSGCSGSGCSGCGGD
jgi:hypothetical protein